jgi:capsule polysaccharide export protein KpsE/RkpR
MFNRIKPRMIVDFVYSLLDELDKKDAELAEVRAIARKLNDQVGSLFLQVQQLKQENTAMKQFIEDNVPEDLKKLIFKEPSETVH